MRAFFSLTKNGHVEHNVSRDLVSVKAITRLHRDWAVLLSLFGSIISMFQKNI